MERRKSSCCTTIKEKALLHKLTYRLPGVIFQYRLCKDGTSYFPFASEMMLDTFGVSHEDIAESADKVFAKIHSEDLPIVLQTLMQSADTLSTWHQEHRIIHNKQVKWLSADANPERESDGSILWTGIITDITKSKQLEERILQFAFHDALTGLPNRRLFNDRLEHSLAVSKRTNTFGAVLFLDMDNFKPLNDKYGHEVGDMLLTQIAKRLRAVCRETDTIARFGGDEFVIILSELSSDKHAAIEQTYNAAEKISIELRKQYHFTLHRQVTAEIIHNCSVSIGAAMFLSDNLSATSIINNADNAMYRAKARGRNKIAFYTDMNNTNMCK